MPGQRGFTVVELVLTLSILALVSGIAVTSGMALSQSVRLTRAASALADRLSLARENAMARDQKWIVAFPTPEPGRTTVDYISITCQAFGTTPCNAAPPSLQEPLRAGAGLGFVHPTPTAPNSLKIEFNGIGAVGHQPVEFQICFFNQQQQCLAGAPTKTVRILAPSGAVQILP